jgi:Spy/CpxP family protein refolding chaperone
MPGSATFGSKIARIAGGIMAAIVLIAVGAGPASAHGFGYGGGWGGAPLVGVPLHSLNLTPDQRTQVMTIMANARSTTRPLVQQLQQAQSSMADALLASPSADVSAQLQAINGLRSQLLQSRVQTTAQVLAVLTPDQLAQAAQIKAQLAQLRSQRRQLLSPAQP